MNSPLIPRHSPIISKSTNIGGKKMARSPIDNNKTKFLNPDPWARLIGRANKEKDHSEWQYSDIECVGFIEADLTFPMGTHVFKTEALLVVLPTTEYQKMVPVTIGTSLTDMAVDSLGTSDTSKLFSPWKPVCFATQTRRKNSSPTSSEANCQNY